MSTQKKISKKKIKIENLIDKHHERTMNVFSLVRLINEYFWKSLMGPFFAFIFPLFFTVLLGYLMSYNLVLGGAISIGSILIGVYTLPTSIFDFKNSSLLKRIGVTPIKPITFVLTVCAYYMIIMIISIFWAIAMSLILFAGNWTCGGSVVVDSGMIINMLQVENIELIFPSILTVLGNIEWGGFIFSQLYVIMTSVTMGMMIVSIAKTNVLIQSVGILTIIICIILGGQVVPIYMVREIEALWYLGYAIDPFKCSMDMGIEVWNGPGSTMDLVITFKNGTIDDSFKNLNINIMNLTGSTIWSVAPNIVSETIPWSEEIIQWNTNAYHVYSTVAMPSGVNTGVIEIVNNVEKIINFIIPWLWIGLFTTISITKFKWTTRYLWKKQLQLI